ncbi:MAG: glycosyl transferase [Bacteroidetes bacterium HGW-Bacteroidetes-4]|jgi:cellulose synthase/poly-beta-1,6-N-acetylglucosamine synthase-like glycosyltransferase|nr:MAG: glycosyl transferase [Bacteroidetes bacterium HGW-Bacteroidetes-4]
MTGLELIFWLLVFLIAYSYLLYPAILWLLTRFYPSSNKTPLNTDELPTVTLLVAAYNEEAFVDEKVANSKALNYPADKLKFIWVTDGSTDQTNQKLEKYTDVTLLFKPERKGKINAMNRAMHFVDSELVIFSDGNTLLSDNTVLEIVKAFTDDKVGCVAGEKRIATTTREDAAASGEGLYWKYESWLKNLDAKVGSCIGAAGELFAIRTALFFEVPGDTLLDDFVISLRIAMQGKRIAYAPQAYALEKASANIAEEMKRKVRIAAGSFQVLSRMPALLNIFKFGKLSWQFVSHKVLRWVVVPMGLLLLIPLNILLVNWSANFFFYFVILLIHSAFYLLVFLGFLLRNKRISAGLLFAPYYFFMANLAMWKGFFRFLTKKQSVQWERARRA